jgi:putative membrane protein
MRVSLALHIIGIVMWLGGLMIGTSALRVLISTGNTEEISRFGKKLLFGFILPGLGIVTLSGLYQLTTNGVGLYMKQGWFHAKLTFILVLFAATALLYFEIKKIMNKGAASESRIMMVHGMSGAVLLVAVFMTMLGR